MAATATIRSAMIRKRSSTSSSTCFSTPTPGYRRRSFLISTPPMIPLHGHQEGRFFHAIMTVMGLHKRQVATAKSGFFLGTRVGNDFPEGTGRGCHGHTEELHRSVSNPPGAAAVEPEGKLLEVGVEVFEAHRSLVGAEIQRLSSEKIR